MTDWLNKSSTVRLVSYAQKSSLTVSDAVSLNAGLLALSLASTSLLLRLRLHHLDQLDDVGFLDKSTGSELDRLISSRSSEDESGSSSL
jgi:hypothetical protein